MFRSLITAMRTLTILPVPGKDSAPMAGALPWFPVVGCVLGLLLYLIACAFALIPGIWAEGTAAVVLAAGVILTRGFHLDGLADWADGFWGGRGRERVLAIMKDSHVGTFGILAVFLVLLLKYVALLQLMRLDCLYWIIPVFIVSRTAITDLSTGLPYARSEGGTAAPFVQNARPSHRFRAYLSALVLLCCFAGVSGPVILAVGFVACRLFGIWFRRRLGGVTGDLLGASCELIETGLLFFCALAGTWLASFSIGKIFDL